MDGKTLNPAKHLSGYSRPINGESGEVAPARNKTSSLVFLCPAFFFPKESFLSNARSPVASMGRSGVNEQNALNLFFKKV